MHIHDWQHKPHDSTAVCHCGATLDRSTGQVTEQTASCCGAVTTPMSAPMGSSPRV